MRDLANNIKVLQALIAAVVTASVNGADIDLQGFNSAALALNVGAEGDTLSGSVKFDFVLQEAPDDGTGSPGTYVNVTDNNKVTYGTVDANGIFATVDDNAEAPAVHRIGYIGIERFIRVVVTATGTHTNGTPIGVVAVLGDPDLKPVA